MVVIQILTESILDEANQGFWLVQDVYYNYSKTHQEKKFIKTDNQLLADTCNVGYAMKHIYTDDYRFGVIYNVFNTNKNTLSAKEKNKKESFNLHRNYATYSITNEKRYARVYTPNQSVYDNVCLSIRDIPLTKYFLRLIELKQDFLTEYIMVVSLCKTKPYGLTINSDDSIVLDENGLVTMLMQNAPPTLFEGMFTTSDGVTFSITDKGKHIFNRLLVFYEYMKTVNF